MRFNKITKMITMLTAAAAVALSVPAEDVLAEETVASVYTNEPVSAAQAATRPIAVMMPTDAVAQPSYGISHAKILYEIMEEGNISRQLAVIDDWQGLSKIGNIRSCRAYYIPEATEWDPILVHFGGVVYMKDRITMVWAVKLPARDSSSVRPTEKRLTMPISVQAVSPRRQGSWGIP